MSARETDAAGHFETDHSGGRLSRLLHLVTALIISPVVAVVASWLIGFGVYTLINEAAGWAVILAGPGLFSAALTIFICRHSKDSTALLFPVSVLIAYAIFVAVGIATYDAN